MGGVTSDIFAPDEQVLSDFSIDLPLVGLLHTQEVTGSSPVPPTTNSATTKTLFVNKIPNTTPS